MALLCFASYVSTSALPGNFKAREAIADILMSRAGTTRRPA